MGAILTQKSANFDTLQIFAISPPKNGNFDNFFKKCNFGQFSISESEK